MRFAAPGRRLPARALLLAAVCSIAACATPVPVGTPTTGPDRVEAPRLAVGDQWDYRLTDGFTRLHVANIRDRVVRAGTDGVAVERTDLDRNHVTTERLTADGRWVEHARPRLATLQYDPPLAALPFPLQVGQKWTARAIVTDPAHPWRYPVRVDGVVSGWERVRVPAGEFDALRIVRTAYHMDGIATRDHTRFNEVEWYAPSIGRSVRFEGNSVSQDLGSSRGFSRLLGDWNVLELSALQRSGSGADAPASR